MRKTQLVYSSCSSDLGNLQRSQNADLDATMAPLGSAPATPLGWPSAKNLTSLCR